MAGWVLTAIVVASAFFVVVIYNGLVRLRAQVKNAWSQIDVQLKRRYDLIPNLVEAVKDYISDEQETIQKVVQARAAAMSATNMADKSQKEGQLSASLKSLFALSENYPDIKANQNVMSLQEGLTSTENRISSARQFYNGSVMELNVKCEMFPSNIVANVFGFTQEEFFSAPEEDPRPVRANLR